MRKDEAMRKRLLEEGVGQEGEEIDKIRRENEGGFFKEEEWENEEGEDGSKEVEEEKEEKEKRRKTIKGIKKKIAKMKHLKKSGERNERVREGKEEEHKDDTILEQKKKEEGINSEEEGRMKKEDERKGEEEVAFRKEEGEWSRIDEKPGWREEGRIERISRVRSIKNVCSSANGLLYILTGDSGCENPKRTSIYIMRVGKRDINGEDIFFTLFEKLNSMIRMTKEGFVELKKGIDLSDLLFFISKNFDNCKELLNLLMSIYDEGFAQKFRNKKKLLNRRSSLNTHRKIDKIVKEHGLKSFLIEKIFLNVLLLIKNEFPLIVDELIIKIQTELYKKVIANDEFKRLSTDNEFYGKIKNNLNWFLADKNIFIKSEDGDKAVDDKKNKIKEEIKIVRCIFTQEEIKEQKAWRCKACNNFGIDYKEKIFYVQKKICPICWNLMKKY